MPRYGHGKAISSFRTSVGVLRSSRGVIYIPELESFGAGYKNFDRFFLCGKNVTALLRTRNATAGFWDRYTPRLVFTFSLV